MFEVKYLQIFLLKTFTLPLSFIFPSYQRHYIEVIILTLNNEICTSLCDKCGCNKSFCVCVSFAHTTLSILHVLFQIHVRRSLYLLKPTIYYPQSIVVFSHLPLPENCVTLQTHSGSQSQAHNSGGLANMTLIA